MLSRPVYRTLVHKLIKLSTNLVYLTHEDRFDSIHKIHLSAGHGERDIMHENTRKRYANITKELLQLNTNIGEDCQLKKKKVRKSLVVKPLISNALNSRCEVDLIDMQCQPDGDFSYIMNYQDLLTKCVVERALRTKHTEEVAGHLADIFCMFGSPHILQSDN